METEGWLVWLSSSSELSPEDGVSGSTDVVGPGEPTMALRRLFLGLQEGVCCDGEAGGVRVSLQFSLGLCLNSEWTGLTHVMAGEERVM